MVRATGSYDPEKYGHVFERIPEGNHKMGITHIQDDIGRNGEPQWILTLQPVDAQYQTQKGYTKWLQCDGVVEALFDSMGHNPRTVDPSRDYQARDFIGQRVTVEVYWKNGSKDNAGKVYANIKRLYPEFSMGGAGPQQQRQSPQQYQGQNPNQNNAQYVGQPTQQYQQQQQQPQQPPQGSYQQPQDNQYSDFDSGYTPPPDDDIPF